VRVAALADVHGNAVALEAVLAELATAQVDLVVFCGDLTWGPLPRETLALVRGLDVPARFVRGNAERALDEDDGERAVWLRSRHSPADLDLARAFEPCVTVDVDGLGSTRFCHGSPRSDEECVTERTPPDRVREFLDGVPERAVVTAHTHVAYERVVDGVRLLNPGSVGMPYEGSPVAAYWAVLGPNVSHRRTEYDVERAVELYRASGDPRAEEMVELLLAPPSREEAIAHAESVRFAG
jgi:predicted phosphodiesterase